MKIKITSLIISFIIILFQTVTAQKGYNLTCEYENIHDGTKVYLCTQQFDTINTAIAINGKFSFSGFLNPTGRFHFLVFDSLTTTANSRAIFLTNSNIQVKGTIGKRDVVINNSPMQDDYGEILKLSDTISKSLNAHQAKANAIGMERNNAISQNDSIKLKKILIELDNWVKEGILLDETNDKKYLSWALAHPNSMISAYLIVNAISTIKNIDHYNLAWEAFSQPVKESYYGIMMENAMKNAVQSKKLVQGGKIPNFSVYDTAGKRIPLFNIIKNDKLTLIDCWASWCTPCRAAIPHLEKVYQEYKDKGFNIIGISSDKNKVNWLSAVSKDGTPWQHYIEDNSKTLSKLFGLKSIPAYILIDSEGTLIAFSGGMSHVKNFGVELSPNAIHNTLKTILH